MSPRASGSLVVAVLAVWLCHTAGAQRVSTGNARDFVPMIREISHQTFVDGREVPAKAIYCLYLGTDETRALDLVDDGLSNISLVHPVPAVAARIKEKAPNRWYASYVDETAGVVRTGLAPLFSDTVWRTIPAPLLHIVAAFGLNDPDLILISENLQSGGVSIYFDPSHDSDKAYYMAKLGLLSAYLEAHDIEVLPSRTDVDPGSGTLLTS